MYHTTWSQNKFKILKLRDNAPVLAVWQKKIYIELLIHCGCLSLVGKTWSDLESADQRNNFTVQSLQQQE